MEEHGVADDDEESPDQKPWEVVFEFLHQSAVEHRSEDEGYDIGEEADPGAEGLVRLHELKIDWDKVDGDERVGRSGGDLRKEDGHFLISDVVDREDTAGECGQDGEGLLKGEEDEEHAGEDEERDYGCAVPCVEDTTK